MNRLWVWISLVIVGVVLIVTLLPFAYREISHSIGFEPPPPDKLEPGGSPEDFRASIERRFWVGMSRTILVSGLFALAAGILLTRWLIKPIRQLEEGAEAISKGQLDYRVPSKGSAEMQSMAESFNHMARELERQQQLRRDMLADVTHELRHPVHVLLGGQQAILDGVYPLSMEEIDRLLEQTRSLTSLVDDLHELALAESNELSLHKQETNLVDLVYYTTEAFQPLAASRDVTLNSELPEKPFSAYVDASRIRQVLQNLLVNALGYTHEGGEVNVSLEKSGAGYALISVRDTGRGIAPEDLDRVFDRFYKSNSSRSRDEPGAGLGLAICKALIENHGGNISVESPGIDSGSTFFFTLPLQMKEGESEESANQSSSVPDTGGEERA